MLLHNTREEKQQSTGRRSARETAGQRGGEGISRKLKNTHCIRSLCLDDVSSIHLVYLILPPLTQQNKTTRYRPLETETEKNGS